jgi:hypothetical protein
MLNGRANKSRIMTACRKIGIVASRLNFSGSREKVAVKIGLVPVSQKKTAQIQTKGIVQFCRSGLYCPGLKTLL